MNETRRGNSAAESIYAINAALLAALFLLVFLGIVVPYVQWLFVTLLLPSILGALVFPGNIGRSYWLILAFAAMIGLFVFGGVIA